MNKAKGKRPLEEDINVPANIDLEESDTDDNELASILRRSRKEHEHLQMKMAPSLATRHLR
ncbi:hypothetical protein TIFTF001_028915 [Ficus carica]|uniref:Uncharacterized protein n=1 Tax=Ficus carica TaxID=3494 RepID=A0AA88DQU8_FICCA|nr:hypothetical protein TIFTF001_028915 [Ficus carica]